MKNFIKILLFSVALVVVLASTITMQNKEKFPHIFNKHSALQRFMLWDNSLLMIKENFVFGVGAGNWQIHFPKYGLEKLTTIEEQNGLITYQRPHNDF